MNIQTVNIHGKQYVPVSERLKLANGDLSSVVTEIVSNDVNEVVVKATIITKKGTFVGHASSSKKSSGIEGQSPIEVAETSALGRALGFAGFGVLEGIASAEEIKVAHAKSEVRASEEGTITREPIDNVTAKCPIHNEIMVERMGQDGNPYWSHKVLLDNGTTRLCYGRKFKS